MAVLHSCPRCTQALPSTAAYCRRCGAVVDGSAPVRVSANPPTRPGALFSAFLAAMLLVAMILGGFVFFRVQSQPTSVQFRSTYYTPPVPQTYPQGDPQFPVYSPMQTLPLYPSPDGRDAHYHDRDDHRWDQHH